MRSVLPAGDRRRRAAPAGAVRFGTYRVQVPRDVLQAPGIPQVLEHSAIDAFVIASGMRPEASKRSVAFAFVSRELMAPATLSVA